MGRDISGLVENYIKVIVNGMVEMKKGIIQVYTGDGKGKTTAAIGLAVRAVGQGLRAVVYQFLKTRDYSGEYKAFIGWEKAPEIIPLGNGQLIMKRQPTEEECRQVREGWHQITKTLFSAKYDLVVIDELSHVINLGMLDCDEVLQVITEKPNEVELVLTGRNMHPEIIRCADLVTEMKALKHPYDTGLLSRKGIEY